jgi:hypothetical protein
MAAARCDQWEHNEHGLWCPACGDLIAPTWFLDDDEYQPPEVCKQCGFPDFEDGTEYFTD